MTEIVFLITKIGKELFVGIPRNDVKPICTLSMFKESYDKLSLYTYKTIFDLPVGSKYVIFSHARRELDFIFGDWQSPDYNPGVFPMSKRIKEDSKNGLVHWVICDDTECNTFDGYADPHIGNFCNALFTVPSNITIITGAHAVGEYKGKLGSKNAYNIVAGRHLERFIIWDDPISNKNQQEKIHSIIRKEHVPYKSLNYNRRPRKARVVIVAHQMHHRYDRALYSLGRFTENAPCDAEQLRNYSWAEDFSEYKKEFEQLHKIGDIHCKIIEANDMSKNHNNLDLDINLADRVGWIHTLKSYFQLVSETWEDRVEIPFITEKSFKPFGMLQPFIVAGPKGNVAALRSYGYRMFDKWIDHSYDEIDDNHRRLRMVLKEFDRLYGIPDNQWVSILYEMLPDLLHNLYTVKNVENWYYQTDLTPILLDFFNKE